MVFNVAGNLTEQELVSNASNITANLPLNTMSANCLHSNTGSFNQKLNYRKFLIIKVIKTEVAN